MDKKVKDSLKSLKSKIQKNTPETLDSKNLILFMKRTFSETKDEKK